MTYRLYGGRGIRVCDRWLASFDNFLADVGARPSMEHSLDRIDTDGHYEPGNVRWATRDVQLRNMRRNVRITAFGETLVLADWSRRTGIPSHAIQRRLRVLGWTPERALTTPSQRPTRGVVR